MAYDKSFYEEQSLGSRCSAKRVVPWLLKHFPVKSAADLGCGLGTWLAEFKACGVEEISGFDGDYVPREYLQIPEADFHPTDLCTGPFPARRFDLAMSLEVAEHLPPEKAEGFVRTLTSLAGIVLFSSAFPYQGGTGHLNENFPEDWALLFRKFGYIPLDLLREEFWNDGAICPWYRQNMLLFIEKSLYDRAFSHLPSADGKPLTRVQPELYLWSCVRPRNADLVQELFEVDKAYYYQLLEAWRGHREMPPSPRRYGQEFNIEYSEMGFWKKLRLKLAYLLHRKRMK
ncbi:MAG: class I SAM-dependent methyltransferase [Lentisphaeria bacterium]|nr:class I SAM-dependent methyltransferase [Lentisphaeria bacterium]